MHWHEQNQSRWESEQRIGRRLLEAFGCGVEGDGTAFMEGIFHLRSQHKHRYDSVTIRIEYPDGFPGRNRAPVVRLMSHRDLWQRGGDSHINSDWSLCLFVPGESGVNFHSNDSLERIFGVLHTFLFKEYLYQQALVRQALTGQKAVWPGAARSHGFAGIAEAVRDEGKVGRNEPCYCGSGKKFKSCCLARLKE